MAMARVLPAEEDDIPLIDALRAELCDYRRQRAAFMQKPDVDPQYRTGILKMWDHAIGVQLAKIAAEEAKG